MILTKTNKDPILVCNHDFQKTWKKIQITDHKNGWFFHENHKFCKVFEITRNDNSLILFFFKG
jgi:hypothetical protein